MKLSLPTSYQNLLDLTGYVRTLVGSITAGWTVEHDADGHHTDITADSITVTGDTDISGDITCNSLTSATFVDAGTTMTAGGNITSSGGYVQAAGAVIAVTGDINAVVGAVLAGAVVGAGTSVVAGTFMDAGTSITAGTTVTAAGLISSTGGAVSANTNVSAGTSISAGTTITAGGNISSTGGALSANTTITAGGNISSTGGSVSANTTVSAGTSVTATTSLNGATANVTGLSTLATISLTGGQIAFPATAAPSSGANTLDDYEEGSWTPVIGGSGGTSGQAYAAQRGQYVKIGRLVICAFYAELSTEGTITTSLQIQGLPFTYLNLSSLNSYCALAWHGFVTNQINVMAQVNANTTTATVSGIAAAATSILTALTAADVGNNSGLGGVLAYYAT